MLFFLKPLYRRLMAGMALSGAVLSERKRKKKKKIEIKEPPSLAELATSSARSRAIKRDEEDQIFLTALLDGLI